MITDLIDSPPMMTSGTALWLPTIRITLRHASDPDDAVTLVVGVEPPEDET